MPDFPAASPPGAARTRGRSTGRRLFRSVLVLGVIGSLAAGGLADVSHLVHPGESLWTIAQQYATTPQALASANHLTDPNRILAGSTLHIPGGPPAAPTGAAAAAKPAAAARTPAAPVPAPPPTLTNHTVARGETLSSIAAANHLTVSVLVSINGLVHPDVLRVGQVIEIPLAVAGTVEGLIVYYAQADGIDPFLAEGLAWQESGWQQKVVSPTGAVGVMQLMPGTASFAGVTLVGHTVNASNLQANIEGGVAFLAYLLKAAGNNPKLAVAGYYQGLASVRSRGMYRTTQQYVANVLALRDRFAAGAR